MNAPLDLYRKYHLERDDERLGLFRGLVERHGPLSALYPGSFVHVTPSFVVPTVVYVDADARGARFFSDPQLLELVRRRREYGPEPTIRFHAQDYEKPLDEPEESFDLLVSQYAGFVSRAGKRFLRVGGHLVANNSHGDASMAALDPDFELVGVYTRRGERFSFSSRELDSRMMPKKGAPPSREELERTMRGPGFTRPAAGYVFRRVR